MNKIFVNFLNEAVKKYFEDRPLIEDESFQVGPQIQTE